MSKKFTGDAAAGSVGKDDAYRRALGQREILAGDVLGTVKGYFPTRHDWTWAGYPEPFFDIDEEIRRCLEVTFDTCKIDNVAAGDAGVPPKRNDGSEGFCFSGNSPTSRVAEFLRELTRLLLRPSPFTIRLQHNGAPFQVCRDFAWASKEVFNV